MITTILIILEQAFIFLPLIIGAYLSIGLLKIPDLSLESAFVFGGMLAAHVNFIMQGTSSILSFFMVLCASLMGGAFVGLTSSLITRKGGLPHLLSSIITIGLFHGITQLIAGSYISLSGYENLLSFLPISSHNPEFFMLALIGLIITFLLFLFLKTQLGFCSAVYGDNPLIFSFYGQSTSYVFITTVVIAGALAGLSGYLCAQTNGFADMHMGFGTVLLCITALILGKTLMGPVATRSGLIPVIGCLSYFILQQLLLKVGFDLQYFTAVQALIVLGILLLNRDKKKALTVDHLGV